MATSTFFLNVLYLLRVWGAGGACGGNVSFDEQKGLMCIVVESQESNFSIQVFFMWSHL